MDVGTAWGVAVGVFTVVACAINVGTVLENRSLRAVRIARTTHDEFEAFLDAVEDSEQRQTASEKRTTQKANQMSAAQAAMEQQERARERRKIKPLMPQTVDGAESAEAELERIQQAGWEANRGG